MSYYQVDGVRCTPGACCVPRESLSGARPPRVWLSRRPGVSRAQWRPPAQCAGASAHRGRGCALRGARPRWASAVAPPRSPSGPSCGPLVPGPVVCASTVGAGPGGRSLWAVRTPPKGHPAKGRPAAPGPPARPPWGAAVAAVWDGLTNRSVARNSVPGSFAACGSAAYLCDPLRSPICMNNKASNGAKKERAPFKARPILLNCVNSTKPPFILLS